MPSLTRIRIELVVSGDSAAALEAVDRALEAGTIQDAIVAASDDESPPDHTWDIVETTSWSDSDKE